ncbi:hypothetical protein [uncultured Pseudoteredinibacter sp.]|uniref:hypothetical protein n=1 Tax=uncultured Pseudoteredinibacter sp. TaxID=1641701 RepID=UPI002617AF85|nr:hypothetical protein [uncultured Pseudoteredinibacter sp.]
MNKSTANPKAKPADKPLNAALLQELQQRQQIWRASEPLPIAKGVTAELEPSRYPELDNALNGGLPKQGLMLINSLFALGEIRLLQHYLRQRLQDRLLAIIAPPQQLSSDAWAAMGINIDQLLLISDTQRDESLWSAEQCLQSGRCAAVLLWEELLQEGKSPDRQGKKRAVTNRQGHINRPANRSINKPINMAEAKRLKLAAEAGSSTMIVFRKPHSAKLAADLHIELEAKPRGLCLHIPKRQRGWPLRNIHIDFSRDWPELCVPKRPQNVISLAGKRQAGKQRAH